MSITAKTLEVIAGLVVTSVIIVASDATAQFGAISGKVTDSRGEPIRHANVYIYDSYCGGMTDEVGEFVLPIVPAGTRTLKVLLPGYVPIRNQKVLVKFGEDTRVELSLEAEPQVTDDRVPWWRSESATRRRGDSSTDASGESNLDSVALRAGIVTDEVPSEGCIDPVRWRAI